MERKKIISKLKKERNKIYSEISKIDKKIRKEEINEIEKEKKSYVGKFFTRDDYKENPEYVKILRYVKKKGYEIISIDVDNEDFWLSRYFTYYLPSGLNRCTKKLFEEKLSKGLKKLK